MLNQGVDMQKRTLSLFAVALGALLLSGCIFGDGDVAETPKDGPRPQPTLRCADLTPAQQRVGDSLVALAQRLQSQDVEAVASIRNPDWKTLDEANARAALGYYNEALAAAPGHCGALF